MSKGKKLGLLATLLVVIIIVLLGVVYYFVVSNDISVNKDLNKQASYPRALQDVTPALKPSEIESSPKATPPKTMQETTTKPSITLDKTLAPKQSTKLATPKPELTKAQKLDALHAKYIKTSHYKKPMIVIIIDDVSSRVHERRIKSVGLANLTPSLFPRQPITPHTPEIAKDFKHYMIHLPLEAGGDYTDKSEWITMGESYRKIKKRIDEIRQDFPDAYYINNHTGHAFTSSKKDMLRLLKALDKDDFEFVDSKTIASNVVNDIGKKRGHFFLARDVFLDNDLDTNYIAKQMETFLKIARLRGYAIAIGHPHPKTIATLKLYKDVINKYYNLVYIGTLDDFLREHVSYYGQKLEPDK
ncbi:hypothetical protein BKH43_02150 [Helicobacter sp. 13S00401-1]|uniref:divergent polysaccharide deacetylase family protein n=1 Tax=Helicobacter sp. 13S00401-1 TaxID=1905758 RepID=UPI000BA5012E|nr:divergent polysaccharide deacetylase family protein [Helicobacter sp. 13S00401-1]PAF51466.1 hypothetical protein BKH43_02150 [Helicobacter sp. 13S00401-1]